MNTSPPNTSSSLLPVSRVMLYLLFILLANALAQSFIYNISGKPERTLAITNFRTKDGKPYPGQAIHQWQIVGPEGWGPMFRVGPVQNSFVWSGSRYQPGQYQLEGLVDQYQVSATAIQNPVSNQPPQIRSIWAKASGSSEVKVEQPASDGMCAGQIFNGEAASCGMQGVAERGVHGGPKICRT